MQIFGKKEGKFLIRKRFNSQRIALGNQYGAGDVI